MTHLSGNFELWGANGPSYPGEGLHSTEWFFDLDAGLTSGKDVTEIAMRIKLSNLAISATSLARRSLAILMTSAILILPQHTICIAESGASSVPVG